LGKRAERRENDCVKSLVRLSAILAALFVVLSSGLPAQGWTAGFKAGLGQGAFTGRSAFAWSASGLNLTSFAQRPLTDRFSAQVELALTQALGQSAVGASTLSVTNNYLALPALLRADFTGRHVSPFVVAGPKVTFHASCSMRFVAAGLVSSQGCVAASLFDRLDFGVDVGAGVRRTIGAATMSIEARFGVGARSVALPDGSGYGRRTGWSVQAGISRPVTKLQIPRYARDDGGIARDDREVARDDNLPSGAIRMELIGADAGDSSRVSLHAFDADVRTVLVTIALQTGVSLIVAEDVRGRVSVALPDTNAVAALRAVVARSGLTISASTVPTSTTTWIVEAPAMRAAQRLPGSAP
jgi:hypothetical protein